jgi:hypothetical protein
MTAFDPPSGAVRTQALGSLSLGALRFGRLISKLRSHPPAPHLDAETVRISAQAKRNSDSGGNEVIIVEAVTEDGKQVDLARLSGPHDRLTDVKIGGGQTLPVGIRLTPGDSLEVPIGRRGSLLLVTHAWSGFARIETAGASRTVDLYAPATAVLEFDVQRMLPLRIETAPRHRLVRKLRNTEFAHELDHHFVELLRKRRAYAGDQAAETLALYTPRWKGVAAATLNLFPCALPIPLTAAEHPDELDDQEIELIADTIAGSPFNTVVFSGGDRAFFRIFEACLRRRPGLSCRILWHSSFLQMGEPHDWNLLLPWLDAAVSGRLTRFGVVKPGMDRFLVAQGVPAVFVQNRVPSQRLMSSVSERSGAVGVWMSGSSDYRKPVAPSLLALASLPGLKLRGAGLGEFGCRLADELRIPALSRSATPIPHADVRAQMRLTDATLYVTISECMPMVPLESMAEGTPCIVGPATELFMDDPGLGELLTVRDPTDPAAIRHTLSSVLDDHAAIRDRCSSFLEALNARSVSTLHAFLR